MENEKENKIKLSDRVAVVGAGKVSTLPKGKKLSVHAGLADKLVKAGKATRSAQ
jgi:hypothetical protein